MDFYKIKERSLKKGVVEIYPDFVVGRTKDLMIRGNSFYAIWDDENKIWSLDEYDVARLVDKDIFEYYEKRVSQNNSDDKFIMRTMADYSSGSWNSFKKYLKQLADNAHVLDLKVTYASSEVTRKDYVSKKLPYSMNDGELDAYEQIVSTLYSEQERQKIEWAIGAILAGDGKTIQKFLVFYGEGGTGKSTMLNIIQKLFQGYYITFDAKELTAANNAFTSGALFSNNPLVAIQHDGDLSGIKDNSKLNSIVAHEEILVNEKYKTQYVAKSNCFLFMGTNKPVKITDAKSGIIRRLIDVRPTGNKLPPDVYNDLFAKIDFELGAIASHCLEVYKSMGKNYYNSYKPTDMMYKTDPFYNFVEEQYLTYKKNDSVTLKAAYAAYKEYTLESDNQYCLPKYKFREELKNYFREYRIESRDDSGNHVRNAYYGFLHEKFEEPWVGNKENDSFIPKPALSLVLDKKESNLDKELANCLAQYANDYETPNKAWSKVKTTLSSLNTTKLHYVKPENPNHIVIDFDLKDENGEKSLERNLAVASKFPKTYAELSKSGKGIHLHYIYDGDVSKLSRLYDENIEIKVFTGDSSLRRKLSLCNDLPIAHIEEGLPLRGDKKVVDFNTIKNEKAIRTMIEKNLRKEYHAATKPSIDFIHDILEQAYSSNLHYDVRDLEGAVYKFALGSTNQSDYCVKLVDKMKFASDDCSEPVDSVCDKIVFYDVEIFPNLFVLCWKLQGEHNVIRLINPAPTDIEAIMKYRLVGFNNRKYDNHIIYAAMMGYSPEQLYRLSQKIINEKTGFFGEAYNLSYTDIYDYTGIKDKSLKKWEIELGIAHIENEYPWDQPVPEDKWNEIADYCTNDVIATEAVFDNTQGQFSARLILAELAGMSANDTTNSLTTRIIFGKEKHPKLVYTDLSETFPGYEFRQYTDEDLEHLGLKKNDYKKHNMYHGEDMGFGGLVYSVPGMYGRAKTSDCVSQHPTSAIELNAFGEYTEKFEELLKIRVLIKHKDFETAKKMMDGKLAKYLNDPSKAKALSGALKIAINSVYGLTSASFDNPFKHPDNVNNIVALRGALFMATLRDVLIEQGYQVMHVKTDSIKVVNPTPESDRIIEEVGKKYGYTLETEHIFERICLVDKANYIAKLADDDPEEPGKWTATGDKFKQPYIFKTLFSHEDIDINDLSEVKSVKSAIYIDMNEGLSEGEHNYIFVGKVGQFTPIKDGCGGGELVRLSGYDEDGNPKYAAVEGTKGWRWKERNVVETFGLEKDINYDYWNQKVDEVVDTLRQYGDVERFLSDDPFSDEFTAMNAPIE